MALPLASKVAIVTGATGLLGVQHCLALSRAGATVVATDLDLQALGNLEDTLRHATDRKPLTIAGDVTSKQDVEQIAALTLVQFGRIDVLVCNAAVNEKVEGPGDASGPVRFEDLPLEVWRKAMDVNLTGTFLCCQVLGAEMARRQSGSIINVASTYGLVAPDPSLYRLPDGTQAFIKSAAYPTTKSGVLGLTRYLAAYWGAVGVRVNALCPGGVENGQSEHFVATYSSRTPLGRMAKSDDYAGALVFLASEASAYMTGATLVVDGGLHGMVSRKGLRERAARIRLVLTDNDGVLTDGGVYYSSRGEAMKRFDVRDGMGVELLRLEGIETGIVSREKSGPLARRAQKLGIRLLFLGIRQKAAQLPRMLEEAGASVAEVAYIGDDVNDLEIIEAVSRQGLTGAPSNAHPSVAQAVHFRCQTHGGHGAFREFAEWLLGARRGADTGRRKS